MTVARRPHRIRYLTYHTNEAIALALGKDDDLIVVREGAKSEFILTTVDGNSGAFKRSWRTQLPVKNIEVNQDGTVLVAFSAPYRSGICHFSVDGAVISCKYMWLSAFGLRLLIRRVVIVWFDALVRCVVIVWSEALLRRFVIVWFEA